MAAKPSQFGAAATSATSRTGFLAHLPRQAVSPDGRQAAGLGGGPGSPARLLAALSGAFRHVEKSRNAAISKELAGPCPGTAT